MRKGLITNRIFNFYRSFPYQFSKLCLILYLQLSLPAMHINCSDKELLVFKKVAEAARELQMPCYLIGGFVRDKLMNRTTKDADIVCAGDGLALAKRASEKFHP